MVLSSDDISTERFYFTNFCEDEWKNFLERVRCKDEEELHMDETSKELHLWASYRAPTLTRTGNL